MRWEETEQGLTAEFEFKNFRRAWAFMNEVALEAEKMDHHPDWSNSYNRVTVSLKTHSAGNKVTDKDRKLSMVIDEIYKSYNTSKSL